MSPEQPQPEHIAEVVPLHPEQPQPEGAVIPLKPEFAQFAQPPGERNPELAAQARAAIEQFKDFETPVLEQQLATLQGEKGASHPAGVRLAEGMGQALAARPDRTPEPQAEPPKVETKRGWSLFRK